MRFTLVLSLFLVSLTTVVADSLESYRWKNRVVVISTPALDNVEYQRQSALFVSVFEGLLRRDIVIKTETGAAVFEVKLIGKDGGEKEVRQQPMHPDELFAIIDAMPMRQAEMRAEPN